MKILLYSWFLVFFEALYCEASSELFTFTATDLFVSLGVVFFAIISFGVGSAHEWHLTLQDMRIETGELLNVQRHQLLAGFKERAVTWTGILGFVAAVLTTQVEKFSGGVKFTTILSGVLILFGPYLLGRNVYMYYLHGAAYRKRKTVSSKRYLPFYFFNVSLLTLIVCYWSMTETFYLMMGNRGVPPAYLYVELAIKNLVALVVTCFMDQTVLTINFLRNVDSAPEKIAMVVPELSRLLGYSEYVEKQKKLKAKRDALEIDEAGVISNVDDPEILFHKGGGL